METLDLYLQLDDNLQKINEECGCWIDRSYDPFALSPPAGCPLAKVWVDLSGLVALRFDLNMIFSGMRRSYASYYLFLCFLFIEWMLYSVVVEFWRFLFYRSHSFYSFFDLLSW